MKEHDCSIVTTCINATLSERKSSRHKTQVLGKGGEIAKKERAISSFIVVERSAVKFPLPTHVPRYPYIPVGTGYE